MSGYRPIYKRIWKDPDFQELDSIDKLLFLYFCTNEAITESGIYPLSPKNISYETGVDITTVRQRLSNGFYKNIIYDNDNNIIFVRKLRKYSTGGRPDLVNKAIISDYRTTRDSFLWVEFLNEYPECNRLLNGWQTVGQLYDTDTDTDVNVNVNNNINNEVAKISNLYEQNIGMITPKIADRLIYISETFPSGWFEKALNEALMQNVRNLKYIERILERWQVDGIQTNKRVNNDTEPTRKLIYRDVDKELAERKKKASENSG